METRKPVDLIPHNLQLPDGVTLVHEGDVVYYLLPDGRKLRAIRGGAFIPLALAIAPYIPQMVSALTSIVKAWTADPMTPEQYRVVMGRHVSNLEALVDDVMAVEIRDIPPDSPQQ